MPLELTPRQFAPITANTNVSPQQNVIYLAAEIGPEWNVVDIHEHRILAVMRREAIENAPGDGGGIRKRRYEIAIVGISAHAY